MDLHSNNCDASHHSDSIKFCQELVKDTHSVFQLVKNIKQRLIGSQFNVKNGNQFLTFRNNLLLDYLVHLVQYTLFKIDKKSVCNHQVINNLFKLRTFIKKTDFVYQKMKYQIEKVVTETESGKLTKNDPLALKPDPQNLMRK